MLSRPQALEHNERKPSNAAAAGPSAWGQSQLGKAKLEGDERVPDLGMKVKAANAGGFMPHYTLGSAPNSSQSPTALQVPSWAQWRKQKPPYTSPCLLGQQTMQSNSGHASPTADPATDPGSPQNSDTHTTPLPPSFCAHPRNHAWGRLPVPCFHFPPRSQLHIKPQDHSQLKQLLFQPLTAQMA